jgi:hypothetical protein
MTTLKQLHANRQNALKSTGPKTPAGKSAVAQNGIKHGLTTTQDVVKGESQADFDLHRDQIYHEYNPSDPMEKHLVDRIVVLTWRLQRSNRTQIATLNSLQYSHKNKDRRLDAILRHKKPDLPPPPDHELGEITVKDFSNSKVIDNLLMHERRIENSLYKAIDQLERKKMIKKLEMLNNDEKTPCDR